MPDTNALPPLSRSDTFHYNKYYPPPKETTPSRPFWRKLFSSSQDSSAAAAAAPEGDPASSSFAHRRSFSSTAFLHRHPPVAPSSTRTKLSSSTPPPPKKVVLYTTSLRTIRRTYEDCRTVKAILKGLRVAVDERDLSMDATYRRELQSLFGGRAVSLPRVFIGWTYIGGVEEIRQMHEAGELEKLLEGVAMEEPGFVCAACGGLRFVPCGNCGGSRKVFEEDEDQMRRCTLCNENGLVRCNDC